MLVTKKKIQETFKAIDHPKRGAWDLNLSNGPPAAASRRWTELQPRSVSPRDCWGWRSGPGRPA